MGIRSEILIYGKNDDVRKRCNRIVFYSFFIIIL